MEGQSRTGVYVAACPTRHVLDRIGDKWTSLIVGVLAGGTRRFGELRREVEGISPRVLSATLRELERDGLVTRTVQSTSPPQVDYTLTSLGTTLEAVLVPVRAWAEQQITTIVEARQAYEQRDEDRTPWQRTPQDIQ